MTRRKTRYDRERVAHVPTDVVVLLYEDHRVGYLFPCRVHLPEVLPRADDGKMRGLVELWQSEGVRGDEMGVVTSKWVTAQA